MGGSGTCRRQTKVVPHWRQCNHTVCIQTPSHEPATYIRLRTSRSAGPSLRARVTGRQRTVVVVVALFRWPARLARTCAVRRPVHRHDTACLLVGRRLATTPATRTEEQDRSDDQRRCRHPGLAGVGVDSARRGARHRILPAVVCCRCCKCRQQTCMYCYS
jgi:hypothetical protein